MSERPTDDELKDAARLIAKAVDDSDGFPMVLFEFGESFTEKYVFLRLDYVKQYGLIARED